MLQIMVLCLLIIGSTDASDCIINGWSEQKERRISASMRLIVLYTF